MSRFIESIKLHNGKVFHLPWHQKRVNVTFNAFFPNFQPLDLQRVINSSELPNHGFFKIRIVFDENSFDLEIQPYTKSIIRNITLKEIDFDYPFKAENRDDIQRLKTLSGTDEIIFTRQGNMLDSSYSNLAFYDGNAWFTPETYLLNGTTRQRLLAEKKVFEKEITIEQLHSFTKISFINALNDLGENTMEINPNTILL